MAENEQKTGFIDKFKAPLSTLWDNHKVFLIIFGIAIIAYKFRSVIIDLLVADSHKKVDEAQNKDVQLREEEKQANDQANQLVKEAEALSKDKPKIDENWNLK